jgi:hypothetical protein
VLSAAPTLSGDVTLSTGNLVVANGKGIDFSATPGTGTSELFADYEEGTWTPSVGGTATYYVQDGRYTKIGRMVFIQAKIQINVLGTGSTTTISGLPFTASSTPLATVGTGAVAYFGTLATAVTTLSACSVPGTATVQFGSLTVAGVTMTNPTVVFGALARIDFALMYEAT